MARMATVDLGQPHLLGAGSCSHVSNPGTSRAIRSRPYTGRVNV